MRPTNIAIKEYSYITMDDNGYRMQLEEISFDQIELRWGAYVNPFEKTLKLKSEKSAIATHFQLVDSVLKSMREPLREQEFVVYKQSVEEYDLEIAPTNNAERKFFELMMSESFFNNFSPAESDFLSRFQNAPTGNFISRMSPDMYTVINEMKSSPYKGQLKGLYLEAKTIELFLMQVSQLDKSTASKSKLSSSDRDCLYDIKHYIEINYQTPCTIIDLAKRAGINQTKLKTGFKELFNNTVFGYIRDLRLTEAKRLLRDDHLFVNEVADLIGYKHPHHFTAAFKKKFGVYPSRLKNT